VLKASISSPTPFIRIFFVMGDEMRSQFHVDMRYPTEAILEPWE